MLAIGEVLWGEIVLFFGIMGILTVLLADLLDWSYIISTFDHVTCTYGYESHNGPCTWKDRYKDSNGKRQSPININTPRTIVLPSETTCPLMWSTEYNIYPKKLRIYNDGRSVYIYGCWENMKRPSISGGNLKGSFEFLNARFRWGPTDDNGSEHSIDFRHFALELQMSHVKSGPIEKDSEDGYLLIVSYLFQVTPVDNPYLDNIIYSLKDVRCPYTRCDLTPFPLSCLTPIFTNNYYTYQGSLTYPPCTEGVQWIIQPQPLTISANQVKQFRKLCCDDGVLISNTRPVQQLRGRDVLFIE